VITAPDDIVFGHPASTSLDKVIITRFPSVSMNIWLRLDVYRSALNPWTLNPEPLFHAYCIRYTKYRCQELFSCFDHLDETWRWN